MTALHKHPVSLTHAHVVAVVALQGVAFQSCWFLGFFGMNHWQKFSTGFDQKPQNKDLEVLVSAAKIPLY